MFRRTLILPCLLTLVVGCSTNAAGPAAPQWGEASDSLGSPGTFMDEPFAAAPTGAVQTGAVQTGAVQTRTVPTGAAAPISASRSTPGGLAAPQIRRGDGSTVQQPARLPESKRAAGTQQAAGGPAAAASSFTFRLQVGDEISMMVWKEEELATQQRIIPGGTIAPPLLGSVRAAGLTLDELGAELTRRYRTYLKAPVVSVNVEGIYSDRVFVLGEVVDAQAVDLHGPTSVVQSVAMAGGFKEEFAEKRTVHLIRRGPGGDPLIYNVNVCAILKGRLTDPPLQRGDIVFVPARGVTEWARTVGQALAPISTGLVSAGAIAGTVAIFNGGN